MDANLNISLCTNCITIICKSNLGFRFSFSPECSTSTITCRLSITYRLVDDACSLTSVDILKDQLLLETKMI
jgi:hypothetical protein